MNFEDRECIIKQFTALEKQYPVASWKLASIQFWPILKWEIFSHLFKKQNQERNLGRTRLSMFQRAWRRVQQYGRAIYVRLTFSPDHVKVVFSGASTYRVMDKGESFNRYFDPMMDYLAQHDTASYLFEYKPLSDAPRYKTARVVDITVLLPLFKRRLDMVGQWEQLKSQESFVSFLTQVQSLAGWNESELRKKLEGWIHEVMSWKLLYTYLFKNTTPLASVGLCYYNPPMYGMNLAAREQGIISVDFQHGMQGRFHPAYTFYNVPTDGYDILPSEFWCWDEDSLHHLQQWTAPSPHRAVLSGNPWITFNNSRMDGEDLSTLKKPLILYTLQPLHPIIDEYMLKAIQETTQQYSWWLRLHPRSTLQEKEALLVLLANMDIDTKVEVEKAGREPLPVLLRQATLHISKYSGAVVEAALMGTPTLVLEEVGVRSYQGLIQEGKAIGLATPNTRSVVNAIENNCKKTTRKQVMIQHEALLDKFVALPTKEIVDLHL